MKFARKRAAVVAFSGVTGKDSMSGAVISARIAQKLLAAGSLDIVERDILDRAAEERTGSSKIVTPGVAVVLGREMGIDAVVAGTVLELKNGSIEVNARMIDTRTGKVIAPPGQGRQGRSRPDDQPRHPVPPMPSWTAGRQRVVNPC